MMDDIPRARDPAEAFDDMRAELSLLSRAIQGLTAERERLPDYSETLGAMDGRLRRIAHNIVVIAEHPAMTLTPETLAERMVTAASVAREADKALITKSEELHRQACADFNRAIGAVRTKEQQRQQLLYAIGGAIVVLSLLWLIYPGWAASLGPQGWLWPERMARRTLGEQTLWDAGVRLMRAGDPQAWEAITAAAQMRHDNRETIAACEQAAVKTRKPVRCTIRIGNR